MQIISEYATYIEIYSIDEAFLFLANNQLNNFDYSKYIKDKVKQKIGLPISIGLGPTKTLSKVANAIAKKNKEGVFEITNANVDEILKTFDVDDVWGIGYRYKKFLQKHLIKTAYDLKNSDDKWISKNLNINGLKTIWELRGIECFSLEDDIQAKKSICVSRSFGKNVTDINEFKEALSFHMTRAAQKLREQNSIATNINIFFQYTKYHDNQRYYNGATFQLPIATSYTPDLIKAGHICLEKIFRKELIYKKLGVILTDIKNADFIQMNTIEKFPNIEKQSKIINTIDKINNKLGKDLVFYASNGIENNWQAKKLKKSPAYTTCWNEILTIKI